MLIQALLETKGDSENPVHSNFNLVMKQIMALRRENQELKDLVRQKSDLNLSPHASYGGGKRQSLTSARSARTTQHGTFDKGTSVSGTL